MFLLLRHLLPFRVVIPCSPGRNIFDQVSGEYIIIYPAAIITQMKYGDDPSTMHIEPRRRTTCMKNRESRIPVSIARQSGLPVCGASDADTGSPTCRSGRRRRSPRGIGGLTEGQDGRGRRPPGMDLAGWRQTAGDNGKRCTAFKAFVQVVLINIKRCSSYRPDFGSETPPWPNWKSAPAATRRRTAARCITRS